ncbi:MAG TPA: LysR substrate-binding domain-containing protein, partial [Steroidobacteraceae bacterium]
TILMPGVLQRLEREAPLVTVEILANDSEPWEALNRGEIDFLVLPKNFVRGDHPSEVLFEDEFVCVCWTGNTRVGETISLEECLSLGHVVARIGEHRPPTVDSWLFERFGHRRRVDVVATTFGSVPHMLVGTKRIAIMHRRLAEAYRRSLPLKVLPMPVESPRLVEMIQWHKYRDRDPARIWMRAVLKDAVHEAASGAS